MNKKPIRMVCQVCITEGKKSTVNILSSSTTLMNSVSYYDEDGVLHTHDMNTTTTDYICSNGHKFTNKTTGGTHSSV